MMLSTTLCVALFGLFASENGGKDENIAGWKISIILKEMIFDKLEVGKLPNNG